MPRKNAAPVLFVPIVASINLRDMVASGVLAEIQRERPDIRIVVLHALPITAKVRALFEGANVEFEPIPEVEFQSHQRILNIRRLRSFVFALSSRNLKTTRVMIGTFKAGTYGEKRPAVYYFFSFMDAWNNRVTEYLYAKLRNLLMKLEIRLYKKLDQPYQKLFNKYKPTMVLSHAPYARAQVPVQRTAIRDKVPIVAVINSWDNITSSGELSMQMSKVLVWSELMKNETVEFLHYKPKDITVTGALQFDSYLKINKLRTKEEFCAAHGLDPKKKIITYTLSSQLLFPREHEIVETLFEMVKSDKKLKDYQLFVRQYPPNDNNSHYDALRKKGVIIYHPSNVRIKEERFLPDEEFLRILIETMKYSDIVVNYPSTIILDAAIFDKPVINIRFDVTKEEEFFKSSARFYEYNHIRYVEDAKATIIVDSPKQLHKALLTLKENPNYKQKERKHFQQLICGEPDGKVYKRVAQTVVKHLQEAEHVRH